MRTLESAAPSKNPARPVSPAPEPPLAGDLRAAILAHQESRNRRESLVDWVKKFNAAFDRRIGRHILRRRENIIIERDLSNLAEVRPSPILSVQRLDEALIPSLIAYVNKIQAIHDARRWVDYALQSRYSAMLALLDEQIVGYLWYATVPQVTAAPHPHLARLGIELAPDEGYMFDLFLDPAARGGGNAVYFVSASQHAMRADGLRYVLGYVASHNLPARVLYRTLGWRETRRIPTVRLFDRFLKSNGRWFVRNGPTDAIPVDYRPLFARSSRAV